MGNNVWQQVKELIKRQTDNNASVIRMAPLVQACVPWPLHNHEEVLAIVHQVLEGQATDENDPAYFAVSTRPADEVDLMLCIGFRWIYVPALDAFLPTESAPTHLLEAAFDYYKHYGQRYKDPADDLSQETESWPPRPERHQERVETSLWQLP